ncbi:component of SufBCD complex [Pseudohalocynthiibacter aestuariivivens]|nr:component of SufBCD complex [Pseudohalocynthiibacter aestuariivivens]QIE44242.1 component of SufBCD complex [Pseudohalocynthiibacter aestuariivivens]
MDWYTSVFELIDMRSFSNLWFWVALAVLWSSASHWVLGVPWDMVLRAGRVGGQPAADMETMVRINSERILYITRESGVLMTGFAGFVLTFLFLVGFVYGREFAQAVFLLGTPMALVWLLSVGTAGRVQRLELSDAALIKQLTRLRFYIRLIGMASIFVTATWGMWQNMSSSALGG